MTTVIEDPETLISRFGWPDYLVFAAMLSVSAIIGVYYAWYIITKILSDIFPKMYANLSH